MESGHISSTAARSGAAASPSYATGIPTAVSATSSKLTYLRRYVRDNASRLLVNKETAGRGGTSYSYLPHKASGTRTIVNKREKRVDESHLGASETRHPNRKPRAPKDKPGFHLRLHNDALGEAEAPLPGTSAVRRRSSRSSSREAAAASFDALQYGRLHHPRAAAYSLTKQDGRQDTVNFGRVKWKTKIPGEEQHRFHYDSDDDSEAPVVVTMEEKDNGKNNEFRCSSAVSAFTPKSSSRREVSGLEDGQSTLRDTSTDAHRTSSTGRVGKSELSKLGRITCVEKARAGARQSGGLGRAHSFEGGPRQRHSVSSDERKDSENDEALSRAEQIIGASQTSSMTNTWQRLRTNVQSWTAQDGDLSPPRRDPNLRFHHGSPRRALDDKDRVHGSQIRANTTSSFAVCSQHKVSVLSNGRESKRPRNSSFCLPIQSNTTASSPEMKRPASGVGDYVRTRQRRSSFSRPAASSRHSNAEHWRNSRNTSEAIDAIVPLPNVTRETMRDRETGSRLSTNATECPRTYEGKNVQPDDERAFTRTRASPTARDDGGHRTNSEMSSERRLRRDSGDLCDGKNPIASAAPDARNRRSHGSPSPTRVIYRDSRGRIITQEEWLELRGPLAGRRRPGRLNTVRGPQVELAWGKGLVQQEERVQATAEEALLGRQPLARYELDKDFDLVLQRKQRWDDPVAKLLDRSSLPQKAAETSSPEYREASRKGRSDGASRKAGDKPKCPFDAPKNRFGIEPGYRWDGVVRGNGYEDRRLKALIKRKLDEQLKHTNNVADM